MSDVSDVFSLHCPSGADHKKLQQASDSIWILHVVVVLQIYTLVWDKVAVDMR